MTINIDTGEVIFLIGSAAATVIRLRLKEIRSKEEDYELKAATETIKSIRIKLSRPEKNMEFLGFRMWDWSRASLEVRVALLNLVNILWVKALKTVSQQATSGICIEDLEIATRNIDRIQRFASRIYFEGKE